MNDLTKEMFQKLQNQSFSPRTTVPAPFVEEFGMIFLAHDPGKSVKVSFPVKEKYNNPMGVTFGGYMGIFFDAAFGPFSGLTVKGPTTSLDLNITYLKPLFPRDKEVIIEVEVVSQSKTYLNLHGKAYKGDRILVATATTRMLIMDLAKMK